MKHNFRNRTIISILIALSSGALGYYWGISSNSACISNRAPYNNDTQCGSAMYKDTISAESAYADIARYGHFVGQMDSVLHFIHLPGSDTNKANIVFTSGWTIPMDDLHHALNGIKPPRYIRAYLALRDTGNGPQSHLILAIVKGINDSTGVGRDSIMNYYYDLIRPCPNMCDSSSRLYKQFLNGYKSVTY